MKYLLSLLTMLFQTPQNVLYYMVIMKCKLNNSNIINPETPFDCKFYIYVKLLERLIKDEELSDPKDTNQYRCDLAERILEATGKIQFTDTLSIVMQVIEDNQILHT